MEQTPTLQIGDKLTLTIEDIAFGGEGVGRKDDFVVFVPFVALGEDVEVELTEVKKRFARAKLLNVLKSSPDRVTPLCPYFGQCGGCQYQHLAYETQMQLKHKQIADLFQRVGGFAATAIAPVVPCPKPYGYRNRIMVRSQWNKFKQGLDIGFLRENSGLVVDIEECKIAEPELSDQIKHVRQHPPHKGGIKVALRIAPEGWEVPRDSFFQNNFFLLPKLVETVREQLKDSGSRFLIDAYCGVGFFGIEASQSVEQFVGVEVDVMAIKAARKNAANRGITNGQFIAARTEELLPDLLKQFDPKATTVVLDPPRTGCAPGMMQLLRDLAPAQVLYVSCHPATLARDLSLLCAEGVFKLEKVTPLDMFPQTQHVECVADVRAAK